ncbi:MAG: hypothetical protein HYY84_05230 [Deltaproteobacteria bacterium]|nr:hypothetical protein [Deltaproteobacteria bacterium]
MSALALSASAPASAAPANEPTYGWEDITHGIHHTRLFSVGSSPARPHTLWVGAAGTLYRSDDEGENWRVVLQFSGGRTRDRIGAAIGRARKRTRRGADDDGAQRDEGGQRERGRVEERVREEILEEHGYSVSDDEIQQEDAVLGETENRTGETRRGAAELPAKRERILLRDKILEVVVSGMHLLVATEDGVYQSRDEGLTWVRSRVDTKRSNRVVTSVALGTAKRGPSRTTFLLAGTRGGLFVSNDAGRTFARVRGPLGHTPVHRVRTDRAAPGEAWVATPAGLWRTVDGGANWTRLRYAPGAPGNVSDVAIDGSRVWIATQGGVYLSRDGTLFEPVVIPGATSSAFHRVVVHPLSPTVLAVARDAIFLSHDSGKTWSDIAYGLPSRRANDVVSDARDARTFTVATDAGVFRRVVEEPGIVTPSKLHALRRRLAADPNATRVVEHVFATWGLDFASLRRLGQRARIAAALPKLTASLSTTIGDRGSGRLLTPYDDILASDSDTWDDSILDLPSGTLRSENRTLWTVFARWDLRRIVFPDEETDGLRAEREIMRKRQKLADQVLAIYQSRRDLLVRSLIFHPKRWRTVLRRELQLARLTAQLDSLTSGNFSQDLDRNLTNLQTERSSP